MSRTRAAGSTATGASAGSSPPDRSAPTESRERYWVSGPRKDGADKLYGGIVQIDEDARVEYWTKVRERPDLVALTEYRAGVHTRTASTTRRNDEKVRGRARARPRSDGR
jgi:hypothetical protein